MDVSIIVPVFNHLTLTQDCLRSLHETVGSIDYEVILVNDGSDEETSQGLRELAGERVKLIENAHNQGFAHSNNIGAIHASGKTLILANNDLVFQPGWLEPMLVAFKKLRRVGLVGNVQRSVSSGEIDHAGTSISAKGNVTHIRQQNRGLFGTPAYSNYNVITGACCAIPRSLYRDLGGFDEAFVNGGEDVDLCFRIAKNGYRVFVANHSEVLHHVSATRKEPNLNDERNSRLLQRRWGPQIANQAAKGWPDRFLAEALKQPKIGAVNLNLLKQALPRFLGIKKGAAPAALYQAECEQERNERHWKARLDGWTDDMIKDNDRKTHSSPLKDRYGYTGLYTYSSDSSGVWIRENATITIPRGALVSSITLIGHLHKQNQDATEEHGKLGLSICVNDSAVSSKYPVNDGDFKIEFDDIPSLARDNTTFDIKLLGVSRSNNFAFIGRKIAKMAFIPKRIKGYFEKFRGQHLNKRLAINSILINGDEVFNFAQDATNPLNTEYVLKHAQLGINLVGWFKAELGIGESVRLAAKALKVSSLPISLVPLKANCLAAQGDSTFAGELTNKNPYPINVFHIDVPQSPDIDHHHSPAFRKGKYNIAYWAWELPDFPDNWTQYFKYYDEVWVPSNFVRDSIAMKSPLPVITIPHCIQFSLPDRDYRTELGLPKDKYLFSFAYDLNSYQERKNPQAALDAFRIASQDERIRGEAGLVIKVHSTKNNQEAFIDLKERIKDLPNVHLIDRTLSREMTYGLMQASDCYLSLHRAEGFGLTLAESMYLEKPVISTNWSATTEFVNASNGCPVDFKLVELTKNHGPYKKGQLWADPNPAHAAQYMVRLVSDPDYAKDLGTKAKQTIVDLYSPDTIANLYRKRLRSIALW